MPTKDRYRKDLRPWLRKCPKALLFALFFTVAPIYFIVGTITSGVPETLDDWLHELDTIKNC